MNADTIIRAWKDPEFRASLTSEQRAALPESPSGKSMTELGEDELGDAVGGVINPTIRFTFTRPSAVDACPSALGCTFNTTIRFTTTETLKTVGTTVVRF
ncbi:mersacidin/lichenicidin family type 2 lantibiotic [Archangium sp.]|jgi:mersacidin/lichenicidin family type 2 lantibiotic|uniref:mersacidin/lichenicidin family type 2 lantibiotic n=1 Tax=Archangium sp. TaxID=1872627 RepID=UPI002EDA7A91